MATDEELALSILRKSMADEASNGFVMVERYDKGGMDGIIDSGRFSINEDEADLLDRLRAERDG